MITIYTLPGCGKCTDIKKIMKSKKIEFEEIDMSNPDNLTDLVIEGIDISHAPIIKKDGKFITSKQGIFKELT